MCHDALQTLQFPYEHVLGGVSMQWPMRSCGTAVPALCDHKEPLPTEALCHISRARPGSRDTVEAHHAVRSCLGDYNQAIWEAALQHRRNTPLRFKKGQKRHGHNELSRYRNSWAKVWHIVWKDILVYQWTYCLEKQYVHRGLFLCRTNIDTHHRIL